MRVWGLGYTRSGRGILSKASFIIEVQALGGLKGFRDWGFESDLMARAISSPGKDLSSLFRMLRRSSSNQSLHEL